MESLADGVFTVDTDWNITFFNRAAGTITGIAPQQALGRKCWDIFHSSLCDGACALRRCIEGGSSRTGQSIFIVRPDGIKVPVSISVAPLRDATGRIIGGVETFRDISDLTKLRKELQGVCTLEDIVTRNKQLARTLDLLPRIAASGSSVLLLGESGTGKELFARAIHNLSPRKNGPFVAVNCGAIPGELLESELFGHAKGAFTDAKTARKGRFTLASGGTLFLDEVGELPLPLQVKLLRVLQERVYEPLGSEKSLPADVRVVAATNRDLPAMAETGTFRRDLFYRLGVARIMLPPLRERPEDIPLLAAAFIERQNLRTGKAVTGLTDAALAVLMRHDYPGNVRELQNSIEYAFILCSAGRIGPEHLPDYLRPGPSPVPEGPMEYGPRALGGRSILGDPRNPEMQKKLNLKIKYREGFRPFAPSVLAEAASDCFILDRPSPYMLLVAPVAEKLRHPLPENYWQLPLFERLYVTRSTLPAITHVDFSARIQTVHAATNPRYHRLISTFNARHGCPVIVNTSFNVRGEPIVCTPEDAYRCFMAWAVSPEMRLMSSTARLICSLAADCSSEAVAMERT